MPIKFSVGPIEEELAEFGVKVSELDINRVKEQAMKRMAEEMVDYVTDAIAAEDDITSPAMNSKYDRGPGSSMVNNDAWNVTKTGANAYSVTPTPKVRQRAVVLNQGYPGTISASGGGYLKFNVNGVPVFRKEVEGPDPTNYWQAAIERLKKSGRLEEIAEEELEEEFNMVFGT